MNLSIACVKLFVTVKEWRIKIVSRIALSTFFDSQMRCLSHEFRASSRWGFYLSMSRKPHQWGLWFMNGLNSWNSDIDGLRVSYTPSAADLKFRYPIPIHPSNRKLAACTPRFSHANVCIFKRKGPGLCLGRLELAASLYYLYRVRLDMNQGMRTWLVQLASWQGS